jgi:hypothetical protein
MSIWRIGISLVVERQRAKPFDRYPNFAAPGGECPQWPLALTGNHRQEKLVAGYLVIISANAAQCSAARSALAP